MLNLCTIRELLWGLNVIINVLSGCQRLSEVFVTPGLKCNVHAFFCSEPVCHLSVTTLPMASSPLSNFIFRLFSGTLGFS